MYVTAQCSILTANGTDILQLSITSSCTVARSIMGLEKFLARLWPHEQTVDSDIQPIIVAVVAYIKV